MLVWERKHLAARGTPTVRNENIVKAFRMLNTSKKISVDQSMISDFKLAFGLFIEPSPLDEKESYYFTTVSMSLDQ